MKKKIWMVCTAFPGYAKEAVPLEKAEEICSKVFKNVMENLPVYGSILAGTILLIVALVIILSKISRAKKKVPVDHLHIEVISGLYASKKKDFPMEHPLIIGSDKSSDIVWHDTEVSAQNARIFMYDGALRIEDLNSPYGTAINGMRIFAPNRLRSGDIVSIGETVQFKIDFTL